MLVQEGLELGLPSAPKYRGRAPRHNIITLLGTHVHPDHVLHVLAKDGRVVVVQSTLDANEQQAEGDARAEVFERKLNIVISLAKCMDFEASNWAYINRTKEGYKLLSRKKALHKLITCSLWARLISIDEVEFTEWVAGGPSSYATGFWEGKAVDIYYGYDTHTTKELNRSMEAALAVRGLDVTYEVYGHLMDTDGHPIGLVVERVWGRRPRSSDMFKIYEAVGRLQRHWCIARGVYSELTAAGTLIAGGKVRITHLPTIKYYPLEERDNFDGLVDLYHWSSLESMVKGLKDHVLQLPHFKHLITVPFIIPISLNPEKPLGATFVQVDLLWPKDWTTTYDSDTGEGQSPFSRDTLTDWNHVVGRKGNREYTLAELNLEFVTLQLGAAKHDSSRRALTANSGRSNSSATDARSRRNGMAAAASVRALAASTHNVKAGGSTSHSGRSRFHPAPRPVRHLSPVSDCTSEEGVPRFEELF